MTKRLYYEDAYSTKFESLVVGTRRSSKGQGIILERTLFYPDSGGQPHDLGTLNGIPVLAVDEGVGDEVIHWFPIDAYLPDGVVCGEIDWTRRFDHMQQHTGQHVLSQAFVELVGADTVGFHLSASYSTIDLNIPGLTPKQLAQAEALANQIIYENRRVVAFIVDDVEVKTLPLRKAPAVTGAIRIVNVEDFDWSACGGTHVQQTGAVGIIKVVRQEHRGGETRLTFLCGGRALTHYDSLNVLMDDLARQLSVGVEEVPTSINRLQSQARSDRKEKAELQQRLVDLEARFLRNEWRQIGSILLLARTFEGRTPDELRQLAKQLVTHPASVVLLGGLPETDDPSGQRKAQVVFARSNDLDHNMHELLIRVCQLVGGGGGGSPDMAQGGGIPEVSLAQALTCAEEWLQS